MKPQHLEPVAIVGIGAIMPGALDKDAFWKNIIGMKSSITEVPDTHWDPRVYYDPDHKAVDKTYSKIGGFIQGFKFNPIKYRIPPQVAAQMDPVQHLAVETAQMALADAGYDAKPFDRERTAVIIGNAMGGMKKEASDLRIYRRTYYELLKKTKTFSGLPAKTSAAVLDELESASAAHFMPITEDTMPGELSNVIAGRVANVFNVNGTNFTVDAACATSLAALDQAINGLRMGNFNMAITGGVDQMMSASAYVKFCKIGALSPDGSYAFDARANGFVMAEGAGMLILKRLSDAMRDGDKIYALIRAIGASSDGRGKGITAPNPKGQKYAIDKAFEQVDYSPADVGFIEAHGTATRVGDVAEMSTLAEVFGKYNLPRESVGVSAVKSQIGHAKAAAGIASVIKATLALHNKTLAPSINFQTPNPNIPWNESPFRVITKPEDWKAKDGKPRRANVSSFGFGGTNFHALLEEFNSGTRMPDFKVMRETIPVTTTATAAPKGLAALHVDGAKLQGESFTFSADTKGELVNTLNTFLRGLKTGEAYPLALQSYDLNTSAAHKNYAISFQAESPAKLREKIAFFTKTSQGMDVWREQSLHLKMKGIYPFHPSVNKSKIGFLFPGQGSQYVDMMKDLASKYQVVQDTFDEADVILKAMIDTTLTEVVWSKPGETAEQLARREDAIKQTQMTQPAVLTADTAMMRLLTQWGVKPAIAIGHSLGEYAAAVASGIFTFENGLRAVTNRAKEMSNIKVTDPGKMASVAAPCEKVEAALKQIKGYVAAANKNCPTQTVIAGEKRAVEEAIKLFTAMGIQAAEIPVSHAFHSEIIREAAEPYSRFLGQIPVGTPNIPILSNVTADYFPQDENGVRDLLVRQITSPVEWMRQLEKMYDSGVRVFVECGPKRVLSALATSTLQDKKDIWVLASNHPKKGGINEFNDLISNMTAIGLPVNWEGKHPLRPAGVYTPAYSEWAAKTSGQSLPETAAVAQPQAITQQTTVHAPSTQEATVLEKFGFNTNDIAVSGIAAGTPGSWKKVFHEGNIDDILRGQNMIEPVSPENQQKQIDKNVTYIIKSQTGESSFEKLTSIEQAVKLAAQAGEFDLVKEFGLPANWVKTMDRTFRLSIAAGILALKDAGIPLVRHYKRTSTGGYLPDCWGLTPSMMDNTGVIFTSAFPTMESVIDEVSRHIADKVGGQAADDIYKFYDGIISKITDPQLRRELSRWFAENFAKYHKEGRQGAYTFSQSFLLKVIPLGHSQFCQWIRARGPSTHISAACSSTTQAVGVAEDWIRTGRAKRILIISADDVTSDVMQEWILAGFLSSGAATTKASVSEAALPFDRRRHGLIAGMGAAALVIEDETEIRARGMRPLARVIATEIANSAFHPTRLDVNHVAQVMDRLVAKAEKRTGISRAEMSKNTLFMSHETYTPARGGSASAEVNALKHTFGASVKNVIVSNVKGFTGHTMGAGMEDVVAVRALNTGTVPPIANYKEPDPELAGITLSQGGEYDLRYALRLGAGFGSQSAMTFIERACKKDESRVENPARYNAWLGEISGQSAPELEVVQNTLRVKDTDQLKRGKPALTVDAPQAYVDTAKVVAARQFPAQSAYKPEPAAAQPAAPSAVAERPAKATAGLSQAGVRREIIGMITEKTGYPEDMLDLDLDMEADLGIDTVKQAELFAAIREHYAIPRKEGVKLKDYPTIRHCINFVLTETGGAASAASAPAVHQTEPAPKPVAVPSVKPAAQTAGKHSETAVKAVIIKLITEKTGYPEDMLDLDLDMEADLGIDTVKQAELFAAIREHYSIPRKEGVKLKDYPTIRHCINFVLTETGGAAQTAFVPAAAPTPVVHKTEPAPAAKPVAQTGGKHNEAEVKTVILKLITEKTGYPEDMLDLDLDMEADLGIDTVKQAELFAAIREHYAIPRKEGVKLKDYPTIRHCINFVLTETGGAAQTAFVPAAAPTPVVHKTEPAPAAKPVAQTGGKHNEAEVKTVILKLITEKTGYPEDMLDLDLDMEADLGIDTVKQAELFAAIREHYSIPRKEGVKLKDYPTIRHCINFVLTETGGAAPVATAPAAAPTPAPVAHETEPAPQPAENRIRLLPVITEVPLAAEANRRLSTKRPVLIFSDSSALTRAFQYELAQMKVPTHVFTSSKTRSKNTTIVNWNSLEETAAALRDYSADNPGVQGIIYLLGAAHKRLDKKADAHADLIHYVMPLFHACKVFEKDLADRTDSDTFIAADLLLDGKFGFFAAKDFDPFYGAIAGAVQCFRKDMHELAKTVTKLMDFEPETSVETIARQTLHEVLKGDDRLAIAMRGGKRQTYYASPVSVDKSRKRFNLEGKSFIITGGGRGLGALFGRLAAQQYKPAIIVFDIIKLRPETPQWAAMSEEQLKALKSSVWETLKADSTRRATPVMLEQEYGRMMDSVQLYRNLEELKRLGAKTDYYTCDVTNLRELDETLRAVKAKYGSVDGVAHFAGLERSKLVNEKTVEEFLRVYDVKAASAMALLASDVVREKGFWMFISSIAGKFGNLGQSDYASASDYIAKLANSLSAKGVRAFAADMSGFAQIGMAARPGVETFLKSQGMEFLQPVEGMQVLLDEIVYGETPEIVLSGTLGKLDWDAQLRLEENAPDSGGETSGGGAPGAGTKTHFLGAIAKLEKGKTLRAEKEFSLAGDPYLADHSISGTPYVPGVMGIETFMEAAATLLGETPAGLEDVHFSLPIKLLRDKPQSVRIAADKNSKTGAVDMNIESDFINPQGVKMGAARKHFSARTLGEFESAYITMPKTGPSRLKPLASKEEVYKIYFHGPSFQVLDSILSVDDKTVFAVYRRPAAPLWRDPQPQTCAYPLLIEAAFQACGFRDLHADKRMTLPDYIGKLLVSPGGASPEKLYISCVFKGKNKEGKSVYDSCVYDADGRLWVELQDYIMIGS